MLVFIDVWTLQRDCASADDVLRRNISDLLHIQVVHSPPHKLAAQMLMLLQT